MERVLIIMKRTKWERDLVRYGSATTAKRIYDRQNFAFERVHDSHVRQTDHLRRLREELPRTRFIYREELPFIDHERYHVLVSFGGDNHFVHVSRFAFGRPVLGLNSDPASSTGALLYFDPPRFLETIRRMRGPDNLVIEEWTQAEGEIELPEGKSVAVGACISEISVHSKFHDYISRYNIRLAGEEWEEQKSSGLLLATGAGSTGWYRNCHPLNEDAVFPKDAEFFRSIARETNWRARGRKRYLDVTVPRGDTLEIISAMDGEVTVDAEPERNFDFPPGALARFRLSAERLRVIREIRD